MSAETQNRRTLIRLIGVGAFMAAMAWAAVPLYDLFCRVTGYGGTTTQADAGSDTILDRTITVQFDASLASDMPWTFKPVEHEMEIRIGETVLAFYEAHNPTDRPVAGTASFNVAPYSTGPYFAKIACFCFEMQVLEPGETVQMPVTFYVDPDLVDDPDANTTSHITLSYTFHVTDLPEDYAGLPVTETNDIN